MAYIKELAIMSKMGKYYTSKIKNNGFKELGTEGQSYYSNCSSVVHRQLLCRYRQ